MRPDGIASMRVLQSTIPRRHEAKLIALPLAGHGRRATYKVVYPRASFDSHDALATHLHAIVEPLLEPGLQTHLPRQRCRLKLADPCISAKMDHVRWVPRITTAPIPQEGEHGLTQRPLLRREALGQAVQETDSGA